VVAAAVVVIELWEQLLARERLLESRESIVTAQEDDLAASEGTLRSVHMEWDTKRNRVEVVR
jgi:hypothetical protein